MNHHYMPTKPLVYVSSQKQKNWTTELKMWVEKGISVDPEFKMNVDVNALKSARSQQLKLPLQAPFAARALYSSLRVHGESPDCDYIFFIETTEHKQNAAWEAILDRIYKASVVRIT
jgi:hypothetical protein